MRFKSLLPKTPVFRIPRLSRLLTTYSVRTRIVVLALIPVVGFLANGLTYMSGERDVGTAFDTVRRSNTLADASRDFKSAIATMRITLKDFTATPSEDLVKTFGQARQIALTSLDTIEASADKNRHDAIAALRETVNGLQSNFDKLVKEQKTLGFGEDDGLRGRLKHASNRIERAINESLNWVAENDANKLIMSLMLMRQEESEYRVNPEELTHQLFTNAYKKFTADFANIDGTPEMKGALEHEVSDYVDIFEQWIESSGRMHPLRMLINIDSQNMLPQADEIIASARQASAAASTALTAAQTRTRTGIISVGVAMAALGPTSSPQTRAGSPSTTATPRQPRP